jgi:hypothetical protein
LIYLPFNEGEIENKGGLTETFGGPPFYYKLKKKIGFKFSWTKGEKIDEETFYIQMVTLFLRCNPRSFLDHGSGYLCRL